MRLLVSPCALSNDKNDKKEMSKKMLFRYSVERVQSSRISGKENKAVSSVTFVFHAESLYIS